MNKFLFNSIIASTTSNFGHPAATLKAVLNLPASRPVRGQGLLMLHQQFHGWESYLYVYVSTGRTKVVTYCIAIGSLPDVGNVGESP